MTVLALTTSHPVSELQRADVVVDSLRQAQPMLVEWMAGAALQPVRPSGVNVTDG